MAAFLVVTLSPLLLLLAILVALAISSLLRALCWDPFFITFDESAEIPSTLERVTVSRTEFDESTFAFP